jgi:hypothetical protein
MSYIAVSFSVRQLTNPPRATISSEAQIQINGIVENPDRIISDSAIVVNFSSDILEQ